MEKVSEAELPYLTGLEVLYIICKTLCYIIIYYAILFHVILCNMI